jgi:hypothetical protein
MDVRQPDLVRFVNCSNSMAYGKKDGEVHGIGIALWAVERVLRASRDLSQEN